MPGVYTVYIYIYIDGQHEYLALLGPGTIR